MVKERMPKKGEVWVDGKDYRVLITDVAIKKKDDIRYNDDYHNEAPAGTYFIYGYNYSNNCYVTGKVTLEEFREQGFDILSPVNGEDSYIANAT